MLPLTIHGGAQTARGLETLEIDVPVAAGYLGPGQSSPVRRYDAYNATTYVAMTSPVSMISNLVS